MEGPSLVILSEELQNFKGKVVKDLIGNTKIDKDRMCNKPVLNILSWGKHLIFQFDTFSIRIHFLMYGSYRVNERREGMNPRLSMVFDDGEINFYNCSIKFIDEDISDVYDWRVDIMSEKWDKKYIQSLVYKQQDEQVCDVIMNQDIFAGVGNIIKNEVLFNVRLDPESIVSHLNVKQLERLIIETRQYSQNFYIWKKEYTLKKHWQIFRKQMCPRCNIKIIRKKTGKLLRWSYYCKKCQRKL